MDRLLMVLLGVVLLLGAVTVDTAFAGELGATFRLGYDMSGSTEGVFEVPGYFPMRFEEDVDSGLTLGVEAYNAISDSFDLGIGIEHALSKDFDQSVGYEVTTTPIYLFGRYAFTDSSTAPCISYRFGYRMIELSNPDGADADHGMYYALGIGARIKSALVEIVMARSSHDLSVMSYNAGDMDYTTVGLQVGFSTGR